ncbi:MAG: SpoVG family protein [Oscillospiraceae bacterium]|nr:SpoVG family protein [Oscillospiraceae bacterium]
MDALEQELMDRLDKNLADYHAQLLGFEKEQLVEMSGHISTVSDAHFYLTEHHEFEEEEILYLLRFENPLKVVADEWQRRNEDISDMEFALQHLFDTRDALSDYPLVGDNAHKNYEERKKPIMTDTNTNAVSEVAGTAEPLKLDVTVRPITPKNNLLAFASVKIADCFVVDNIKIVAGDKGLFVNMPSAQDGKGKFHDVCFPVTADFRQHLQTAVLDGYTAAVEKVQNIGAAQREFTEKPSIKDMLREGTKASAERAAAMPKTPEASKGKENAL